ncbi:MAG: SDR family NAD(P)-dependent oxidoreductase [Anaerolineaceae bacterium]|nr:SDR family NAD(P)-dependent oxidoreductase [Anaerolineaceae bacterium]
MPNLTPLQSQRILVTGAGGFIGSHLVEQLVQSGASLRAFVRYNSRRDPGLLRQLPAALLSQVELFPGDLRDEDAVRQAVQGCQTVFHLGALISIPYSYLHPREVADVNLIGTLNVLTACRDLGVQRLIHTSTSEVYGTARRVPIDESHPLQGQSPYSATKIAADKLAESFFDTYNLPVITVRPFNTFGPRQSARAVIPTIITQALTQSVLRLGNLDSTRDFTYVSDTVAGFIHAALAPAGCLGQAFNLGTGQEVSIAQLVEIVFEKIGRRLEIEQDSQRLRPVNSEVQRLLSDNTLARRQLAWQPLVSLPQGLDLTIAWIRDHLDLYQIGKYEF